MRIYTVCLEEGSGNFSAKTAVVDTFLIAEPLHIHDLRRIRQKVIYWP
jgi:hypothetical protein